MNILLSPMLQKLSLSGREDVTKDILARYTENGYTIVHFLYFATIILNKLDRENDASEKKAAFMQALGS